MKKYLVFALVVLLVGALATGALAMGPTKPAGRGGLLYLVEKDPSDWSIVDGGAWGKMRYNLEGGEFNFVFNGHGLEPGTAYTLIYYPDPWPGSDLICLGLGTADEFGDVHIMGSVVTGDLPAEGDTNEGAKIWLVLSSDVSCGEQMTGWTPAEYLFEYNLIFIPD